MSDRYKNLDAYLPPTPAAGAEEPQPPPTPTTTRGRRLRLRSLTRGFVLIAVASLVATAAGVGAARLTVTGRSTFETSFEPRHVAGDAGIAQPRSAARLSLKDLLDEPERVDHRRRPQPHRNDRNRQRRPESPVANQVAAAPVQAPEVDRGGGERARAVSKDGSTEPRKKKPPKPALPAPPGTPLFHCYSDQWGDHYTTTDRASAAQAESSKKSYDCSILGYVYSYAAPGTRAVELDYGTAYVFEDEDAKTEPGCEKVALYRYSSETDVWFSRTPGKAPPVGYIKA